MYNTLDEQEHEMATQFQHTTGKQQQQEATLQYEEKLTQQQRVQAEQKETFQALHKQQKELFEARQHLIATQLTLLANVAESYRIPELGGNPTFKVITMTESVSLYGKLHGGGFFPESAVVKSYV